MSNVLSALTRAVRSAAVFNPDVQVAPVWAPWYHLGSQYGGKEGDRINDHHLTLEKTQGPKGD